MKQNFKKNYIYICITILLLCIYVIFFPFISTILTNLSPALTTCPYLALTGKPCPLCGGTRYFSNMSYALRDITYLFHPFGIIFFVIIFELLFRIYVLIKSKKNSITKRLIYFDLIYHAIVIVSFFSYEILYLLNQT